MYESQFPGAELPDTRITDVTDFPAEAGCEGLRICLTSTPGTSSYIQSELWLPKQWNGRFLGTGNGGSAGTIVERSLIRYAKLGYAVANTDLGTSRGIESGVQNPDLWMDFGWRATYLMTICGLSLTKSHYGTAPAYAYFDGHSTGGGQALAMAQRYPQLYDGIIASSPANNRTHLQMYFLWVYTHILPCGGMPLFAVEQYRQISDAAVQFHQEREDGVPGDNFITWPRAGAEDIEAFLAYLPTRMTGLQQAQLDALRAIYRGPVDGRTGRQIYNGVPLGSEGYGNLLSCCVPGTPIPRFYTFIWGFGTEYDGYSFDFGADVERQNARVGVEINANDPDLRRFRDHGGKLLMLSGTADPIVPYPDAMGYADRVRAICGADTADFFRYFLIPGKDHGSNGPVRGMTATAEGGIMLDALRRWREDGQAPDALWALMRAKQVRPIPYYTAAPRPVPYCEME